MRLTERQLAAKIQAGDPDAFRALYDAYAGRILGYALRLTGSRSEAEDLTQETFVAAYVGRESFSGKAKAISWLLGISTRRWRDHLRRRAVTSSPLSDLESAEPKQAFPQSGFEREVVDALTLTRALDQLEPPFREALLLVRSQGLTYAEAAAILEEPEGTVKWRVSIAARKAQEQLERIEGEFHEMQRQPARAD